VAKKLVGIFGGSFDPVHHGHLRSMVELDEALSLDQLRLMPNRQSPLKDQPGASSEQRLAMLQLATKHQPNWLIDERELQRSGPSYTVDSLLELKAELKQEIASDAHLCLIMGSDAFAAFDRWQQWQTILELAHLVIMARPGEHLPEQGAVADLLSERKAGSVSELTGNTAGRILLQKLTPMRVSATEIRQRLQAGHSIRYLVPDSVWEYVCKHRLYGAV